MNDVSELLADLPRRHVTPDDGVGLHLDEQPACSYPPEAGSDRPPPQGPCGARGRLGAHALALIRRACARVAPRSDHNGPDERAVEDMAASGRAGARSARPSCLPAHLRLTRASLCLLVARAAEGARREARPLCAAVAPPAGRTVEGAHWLQRAYSAGCATLRWRRGLGGLFEEPPELTLTRLALAVRVVTGMRVHDTASSTRTT